MSGSTFYHAEPVFAENEDDGVQTGRKSVDIPVGLHGFNTVRAHVMLTHVGSRGKHQGFGANCWIEEYTHSDNEKVPGDHRSLVGNSIKNIKCRVDAWNGSAEGLLIVEA